MRLNIIEFLETGLASRFIDNLGELMEKLWEGGKQKGAFFIKSQSQKLKHIISLKECIWWISRAAKHLSLKESDFAYIKSKWVVLSTLMRRKKRVGLWLSFWSQ